MVPGSPSTSRWRSVSGMPRRWQATIGGCLARMRPCRARCSGWGRAASSGSAAVAAAGEWFVISGRELARAGPGQRVVDTFAALGPQGHSAFPAGGPARPHGVGCWWRLGQSPLYPDLLLETCHQLLGEAATSPVEANAPKLQGRVLVADDHPINRALLARQLAILGVDAEVVDDGDKALRTGRGRHSPCC